MLLVIVLLGVVAAALMTLSGRLAVQSAEALRTRQALALAQALLAEVGHMPFTFCDPGDAQAHSATAATLGASGCATTVDTMVQEPGETRYHTAPAANRYDGVSDYNGFMMPGPGCPTGLCDIQGNIITNAPNSSLAGCSVSVLTTPQAITVAFPIPPAFAIAALDANGQPQALRITVSVTCPGLQPLVLEGLRVRHAPNWF